MPDRRQSKKKKALPPRARKTGEVPTACTAVRIIDGDSGAYAEMLGWTMLRSIAVAPGLAVAGVRGKQLFWGSLAASLGITVFAITLAFVETRGDRRAKRTET